MLLGAGRDGDVRPLRNRQNRDVALGDRLREEIELLLGELVLLVVDVASLAKHGHDRLDRVELGVDGRVALELGVVLRLGDLTTRERVLQSSRLQDRLVDREPEIDEEVPAAELLSEHRQLLGHVGLEVAPARSVVDVEVGAGLVVAGRCRCCTLDGLLDVDVEHGVPTVVVVAVDVGVLAAPLLETDLLVERAKGGTVGVQRERCHTADEQRDVVLDDLDRCPIGALVERELVGSLAGRVVVEVVADSRELLVRRAEAVDVALARRDDGVVLVVDSRLSGRGADLRAARQRRDRHREGDDDDGELGLGDHEISLGLSLIHRSMGSAYSLGMRTAGSASSFLMMSSAFFSASRCLTRCSRTRGLSPSKRRRSGALRARSAWRLRLMPSRTSAISPMTSSTGMTINSKPASKRAMAFHPNALVLCFPDRTLATS